MGTAAAEPDPLEQRLLGPAPAEVVVPPELPPPPEVPWWPIPTALVGFGLLIWARQRALVGVSGEGSQVRMISSLALGSSGGVTLLEVEDVNGSRRRLLVGTGSGPPRLIAELGVEGEAFERAFDSAAATEGKEADALIDTMLAAAGSR
jgi:hypothetical protein